MKGLVEESSSVLMNVFGSIMHIEDIRITYHSNQEFVMTLEEKGNGMFHIHVICLNRAVPSSVKTVVNQSDGYGYRIIMAPYISDASARICEESGVGYCDLSGNCLIRIKYIYISSKGNPNRYPVENHAKTIFRTSAKTTSMILRELLKDVSKRWRTKDLAEAVGCSIGMVSRVKTYLCEQAWAETDSSGLYISDPEALMREWGHAYEKPDSISCYTLDSLSLFEKRCYEAVQSHGLELCLSGFSGGVRYAPVVRYTKAHVWVSRKNLEEFLKLTGCKKVDSGANVVIYIAYSNEVFFDSREIDGSRVASPVQVFLDCMQLKGRGEEMAEAVFAKEIRK